MPFFSSALSLTLQFFLHTFNMFASVFHLPDVLPGCKLNPKHKRIKSHLYSQSSAPLLGCTADLPSENMT